MPEPIRVGVLDYGSGNLHSVVHALTEAGARVVLGEAGQLVDTHAVVIPGVGAFSACMDGLVEAGGDHLIRQRLAQGRPVLGICVGHQVMFGQGREHEVERAGVGIIAGVVEQLHSQRLPHMGWNTVTPQGPSTLFTDPDQRYYFVHSYGVRELPDDFGGVASWTHHDGERFVAALEMGPLTSLQFHPEKSGRAGLELLRRWLDGADRLGSIS